MGTRRSHLSVQLFVAILAVAIAVPAGLLPARARAGPDEPE